MMMDYVFKMVVIADSAVGKTQLLSGFSKNEFSTKSPATAGVEFQTDHPHRQRRVLRPRYGTLQARSDAVPSPAPTIVVRLVLSSSMTLPNTTVLSRPPRPWRPQHCLHARRQQVQPRGTEGSTSGVGQGAGSKRRTALLGDTGDGCNECGEGLSDGSGEDLSDCQQEITRQQRREAASGAVKSWLRGTRLDVKESPQRYQCCSK